MSMQIILPKHHHTDIRLPDNLIHWEREIMYILFKICPLSNTLFKNWYCLSNYI